MARRPLSPVPASVFSVVSLAKKKYAHPRNVRTSPRGGQEFLRVAPGWAWKDFLSPSSIAAQGIVATGIWVRLINVSSLCLHGAEQWDAEMNKTLSLLSRSPQP